MNTKLMISGAALGLLLGTAAFAQSMPSSLMACPAGTQYSSANPKLAASEGAGAANPKLAASEGAGAANPKLAASEGAGAANPKLASAEGSSGMAKKLSNGVARLPDGTYCSPVQ